MTMIYFYIQYFVIPTAIHLYRCWRGHTTPDTHAIFMHAIKCAYISRFAGNDGFTQTSPTLKEVKNIEIELKKIPFIYKWNLVDGENRISLIRFFNPQDKKLNMIHVVMFNRISLSIMIIFCGIGGIVIIITTWKISKHLYKRLKSQHDSKYQNKPEKHK